jgi:hypothetical protein
MEHGTGMEKESTGTMANVNLLKALAAVRNNIFVEKTGKNSYHNNKYYELPELVSALRRTPEHDIYWVQRIEDDYVVTQVAHGETGETESSIMKLADGKYQDRAAGITYLRRIQLVTLFGLAEQDDDGNLADGLGATSPAASPGRGSQSNHSPASPPTSSRPFSDTALTRALSRCDSAEKVKSLYNTNYQKKGLTLTEAEETIFNQRYSELGV